MTTRTLDSFTDTAGTVLTSHTGETGATWTKTTGTGSVVVTAAGRLRGNATQNVYYYSSGVCATDEMDVTADVVQRSAASASVSIYGRLNTTQATGYFAQRTTNWSLRKIVNTSVTFLASFAQALTTDQVYALKLEVRAAAKKVYVDGVEILSNADNAITGDVHGGIECTGAVSDSTGLHLDNFVLSDLSSAATSYLPPNRLARNTLLRM